MKLIKSVVAKGGSVDGFAGNLCVCVCVCVITLEMYDKDNMDKGLFSDDSKYGQQPVTITEPCAHNVLKAGLNTY